MIDTPADTSSLLDAIHLATGGDPERRGSLLDLSAKGIRDLTGIEGCPQLRSLDLTGCDLSDLRPLASLRQLRSLSARFSRLADLSPVTSLPSISRIDLTFSSVTDPLGLLEVPTLERLILIGCPLSDEAWARLDSRPSGQGPVCQRSTRPDWLATRSFWDAGDAALFSYLNGRWVLAAPGIPTHPDRICDFVVGFDTGKIRAIRRRLAGPADQLVPQIVAWAKQETLVDPSSGAPLQEGDADDALRWVAQAGLPVDLDRALGSLVRGFPALRWFRATSEALAQQQARLPAPLPAWYSSLQAAAAGVEPQEASWVWIEGAQNGSHGDAWYTLDLGDALLGANPAILERYHLLPVAEHLGAPEQALCIRADNPSDSAIYRILLSDGDVRLAGSPRVFSSYAELLDNVTKIRLENGKIIGRN